MTADPLADIVDLLDDAGVQAMLAGSFASSFHGLARATMDIDLVIDPDGPSLDRLLGSLDRSRYYVDDAFARESLRRRDQFNVVDQRTGWKIDLIIRKDRPFSQAEFDRRQPAEVLGVRVAVASPEDTVLAKLEWAAMGASDRQLQDAAGVLRVRPDVDDAYLDEWAEALGVSDLLARARSMARH